MIAYFHSNPFARAALIAVPPAFLIQMATRDLGHELTWFGHLTQTQSAYLRHSIIAFSIVVLVIAIVAHFRRSQI